MPHEGAVQHAPRLVVPPGLDRARRGVEHQRDAGHRLDGPVVELVGKPAPLVLLGCDQLLGEPCPLGLARLGLGEELRVVGRTGGEVGENCGADEVAAVEGAISLEAERGDLAAPSAEGDPRRLAVRLVRLLARRQERSACAEELLGLAPGLLEHLVRVEGRGDRAHRLDKGLEEAGLRRQLVLDSLVPAPLPDDQVEREGGRRSEGRHERRERERPERAEQGQHERGHRQHDRGREERGPNR